MPKVRFLFFANVSVIKVIKETRIPEPLGSGVLYNSIGERVKVRFELGISLFPAQAYMCQRLCVNMGEGVSVCE